MTLGLTEDGAVVATGLRDALGFGGRLALIALNREHGLFLGSVQFLRSGHPGDR
jgi:hypothetical protein